MRTWHSVSEWMERRRVLEGRDIGFVPTMGALHRGHISLVERCRQESEVVVASIFVNPLQFNDPKDLERYPRTLDGDLDMLEAAGTDEVILPTAPQLYPNGYDFQVEPGGSSRLMEGAYRPGFFRGVTTVVLKLLNLVRPQRAYFGEKDYQQWRVIREMAGEFFMPTEIVRCPTIREDSGLAASSRNMLLSEKGRKKAAALFRILSTAQSSDDARKALAREGFAVDYVEEHWGRRFAAAFLESVRLIDNVPVPGSTTTAQ